MNKAAYELRNSFKPHVSLNPAFILSAIFRIKEERFSKP